MEQYIKMMEKWFAKLPPLPKNVTDIIVKFAPWLALIFGILGILGSGFGVVTGGIFGPVLALVGSVLMLMAYPGLRDRKMAGWKYSFYSEAVSVAASVLALNLFGAVISGLISFYLLFQVKSYYK